MDGPDLDDPALYINRELSWLTFNRRVLALASDAEVPLLERLRFLCITSSNLDEFFEVRVAGLIQQAKYGAAKSGPDQLAPAEVLARIAAQTHDLVTEQYRLLNEEMIPALETEGIRFLRRGQWTAAQGEWIRHYFEEQLLPIVSPIRLDPAHPFPRVQNKALHFIVSISGEDAFGQAGGMAVVQAPRPLPRLIRLPEEVSGRPHDFVFLSSIIHAHVGDLFPGMEVLDCYQFRVTRNSDLFVDPEEVDDLMGALQGELPSRHYGEGVRLEVADNCPDEAVAFLLGHFHLEPNEVYRVNGPVNLHRLMTLPDLVERPDLKYPGFTPGLPPGLAPDSNMFDAIGQGDILLHHPFQSFTPVIDFVRQAAADPDVLAIKQTLYRTGSESVLVDALVNAARAGKEVTVVVELRARFDEEANISLAATLQEAGAHVVFGVVGYKTHAKMLLVVRREGGRLKRYVHLGTGNYHARTARIYTDYGLLTADPEIGADVHRVFMQLTSLGTATELGRILQAPFSLHTAIIEHIEREARHARSGKPARIIAKLNGLIDPVVIKALYEASRAGVRIDLVVRGICGLCPGVPGVSENIRVRSIIGRFLEHTRIYYFGNGGEPALFLASADWMPRNLYQRVETGFPLLDESLRRQVIEQGLMRYLADNCQAWELDAGGEYHRVRPRPGERRRCAQEQLLAELAATSQPPQATLKALGQIPPARTQRRGDRRGESVT
ncbi:MAG: polyphosphate kinase 1 [Gammaproteobacteria bacterium]|nr:polyphosphate kinase 1 [Gammaproteobacteria bacterium]